MKKILGLVLFLLGVGAAPAHAGSCERLLARKDLHSLSMESVLRETGISDRRLTKNLFLEVKRMLRKNKVRFDEVLDNGNLALRILPGKDHPLSDLAERLSRDLGAELIYSPMNLVKHQVEGAGGYRPHENGGDALALFIGTEWILDEDRFTRHPGILHEIWHIKNFALKEKQVSNPYMAVIFADQGLIPHGVKNYRGNTYENFLSLEELEAFRITVYADTIRLMRMIRRGTFSEEEIEYQALVLMERARQWRVISSQVFLFMGRLMEGLDVPESVSFSESSDNGFQSLILWGVPVGENSLGVEIEFPEFPAGTPANEEALDRRLTEMIEMATAYEQRTGLLMPLLDRLGGNISNEERTELARAILKLLPKVY